ncbi:hypothetical protein APHAL10511_008289 [Amanita phalloides]|nr:hypothetical protein APHAL10511_008289 [Amanita phalloides]
MSTALQPPCPALPPPRHEPKATRHPTPDPPTSTPSSPRDAPDQPEPSSPNKDKPKDEPKDDAIDMETFIQIIELDEDDRDFSTGMVEAYFEQAIVTFKNMDSALEKKDLEKLSSLGHYLKGSSAALGVVKVQDSCEKIQHYGQCQDEKRNRLSDEEALAKIGLTLSQVKEEYAAAEEWLKDWLNADVA